MGSLDNADRIISGGGATVHSLPLPRMAPIEVGKEKWISPARFFLSCRIASMTDWGSRSPGSRRGSPNFSSTLETVNAVPVHSLRDIYSVRLSRPGVPSAVASQGPNVLAAMAAASPEEKWWVHTISSDDVRFVVFVRDGGGPTACLDLSVLAPGSDGAD